MHLYTLKKTLFYTLLQLNNNTITGLEKNPLVCSLCQVDLLTELVNSLKFYNIVFLFSTGPVNTDYWKDDQPMVSLYANLEKNIQIQSCDPGAVFTKFSKSRSRSDLEIQNLQT